MKTNKLPAGLVDEGVEFFIHDNKISATHNGRILNYMDLPDKILDKIRDEMINRPGAIKALADMHKTSDSEMLFEFIKCNFGGYDHSPDISVDGKIKAEYWDCGQRGVCAHEGKLCEGIKVGDKVLTTREIELLKLIAKGKFDKEIADILNMSINTVASHKQNLQEKTGLQTKIEFAVFAVNKNLI